MKRLPGILLAASVAIAAPAASDGPAPSRGDRGTLLTTLSPDGPEEIPVTYLGTYHDFAGPGHDVHLVEMEGPLAEKVGAANGMSGSPVYFDGRLLGALAYRLGALPKSPIAGITPIEDMRDAARAPVAPPAADAGSIRPITTPVFLGGVAPVLRAWAEPHLAELGLVSVAGSIDAGGAPAEPELAPGRAIGVELVRGDLRIAASGTVTLIEGDTVYAFGHPFFGSGRVEMPMAPAEVIHTLADFAGSYHMVNVGSSVGAIVEDRQAAIVGRLGRRARMVPVALRVRGGDFGDERFDFEIVGGSTVTPLLAAVTISNALFQSNGYTDEATVMARGSLRLKGLPVLPLEMAFSASQGVDPSVAVAGTLFSTLNGLWNNPHEKVAVERIDLELDVRTEPISYRVESLHYDRGSLRPGERLTVHCVLREHRGGTLTRRLELELPERLPRSGRLTLVVGSPAGVDGAIGGPVARRMRTSRDLRGVVEALADQRSAHRLTAVVYEQGGTVVARGTTYDRLPPTAERLLATGVPRNERSGGRPLVSTLARTEVELEGPVQGGQQVRLKIDRGFGTEEDR